MKKWLFQARIQKGISFLPSAHRLNYLFLQKSAFGKILPAAYYMPRLTFLHNHLQARAEHLKGETANLRILEIGTGLHLFTPVGFFLAGYNHITTLDTKKLFTRHTLAQTLSVFREQQLLGTLQNYIPELDSGRMELVHQLHENMKRMKPEDVLRELQINLVVTKKTSALPFKDYSFDFVVSNNALQEISVSALMRLMPELARISVPGGAASHYIDLRDQFSYVDESVSPFNYLQFSDEKWRSITNKLVRQNRMRINFYRNLFKASGLHIVAEDNQSGDPAQLDGIELDIDFEGLQKEDILVIKSHLVALRR